MMENNSGLKFIWNGIYIVCEKCVKEIKLCSLWIRFGLKKFFHSLIFLLCRFWNEFFFIDKKQKIQTIVCPLQKSCYVITHAARVQYFFNIGTSLSNIDMKSCNKRVIDLYFSVCTCSVMEQYCIPRATHSSYIYSSTSSVTCKN